MALVHNAELAPFGRDSIKNESHEVRELITTLTLMGYEREYVERAIQVHKKSKFGCNWDLSLLVDIILRLKEKDKDTIFIPHFMNKEHAMRLNVGETVDYRYDNGRFILCRILQKRYKGNNNCIMRLHPMGRPPSDTKYDKTCDIYHEYHRLATAKSISLRRIKSPKHMFYNMKIDHFIDINPIYKAGHEGWKSGRILKRDPNSSQIKVLYHNDADNNNYTYWVHLQNSEEVAEFRSKCEKVDSQQLDEFPVRPSSESVFVAAYQPPNAAPLLKVMKQKNNNHIKHNHKVDHGINSIQPIARSDFDNDLSSVALGNKILMADIVDDMANKHKSDATPMGHEADYNQKIKQARKTSLVLQSSHSNNIDSDDVMAPNKQDEEQEMIRKLQNIGYKTQNIMEAMAKVSDVHDINMMMDYMDTHRMTTNIHFKVRQKTYDANANKSEEEHIDVDAIKFDDDADDDRKEDRLPYDANITIESNDEQVKYLQNDIRFYIECEEYISNDKEHYEDKAYEQKTRFVACMEMRDIYHLKEMDCIDFKNIFGQFMRAIVIAKNEQTNVLNIRFQGMTHQHKMEHVWDGWIAMRPTNQHKFAAYQSISCRESNNLAFKYLRTGSLVELRPISPMYHEYCEWQRAEIYRKDYKSGQIQCKYKYKNNYYLYWTHIDNEAEVSHIDNFYEVEDDVCVYNESEHKWMMANVIEVDVNEITVCYVDGESKEEIHVLFDEEKLLFPTLKQDIKYMNDAIHKEKLKWKLVRITATNNTIYQCFAWFIYGDLNLAIHLKDECIKYIVKNRKELQQEVKSYNIKLRDAIYIIALCKIYLVRIRIVEYKVKAKRLNMILNHGVDDLNVPIILLSKHLNKYYNIIIDQQSIHKIPFYYQ